ncbi:DUF2304 domain-containing protein [Candidatus Parcubacteria bacterium]|jgi:hypothetical protein|nr:MAG: DUF2304 domain-containing protein [Candidatus Parcubacteria bacterium]
MITIQLIGILFTIFILYLTYLQFKKGTLSGVMFSFWAVLWIGLLLVSIFPSVVNGFLAGLGINRALDLFVIVAIFLILGISFYNYTQVRKLHLKIEKLVRHEALKSIEEKNQQ